MLTTKKVQDKWITVMYKKSTSGKVSLQKCLQVKNHVGLPLRNGYKAVSKTISDGDMEEYETLTPCL